MGAVNGGHEYMFKPDIKPGATLSNDQIMGIFGCGKQGGMRRSRTTDTLVLITDKLKGTYKDRWEGDILHYTGMGLIGDQYLFGSQNRTLNDSQTNGVGLFLFEVFEKRKYYYHGRVKLAGKPYQEVQLDRKGNLRNVWIFPLTLIGPANSPVHVDLVQQAEKASEKRASVSPLAELINRIKAASKKAGFRNTIQILYERNSDVADYVKRKADGICQLCGNPAPFNDKSGVPYLEEHHIVWLVEGGADAVYNVAALCPNCHRKMHVLNLPEDRSVLVIKAAKGHQSLESDI